MAVPEYTGTVPNRRQPSDQFNDNTAAFLQYVGTLAPAINTTAQQMNDTAANVAQDTAVEAAARTAIEVEAALSQYVTDASGFADDAASSATFADNMADAVAQATATYTTVAAGLSGAASGDYFRVIEAPEAERVSVYRNDAGSATLITTYYTKTGVDAKQAAAVRLNRSLQRLGDNGQTLHSDFNLAAYGIGSQLVGGVQDAMEAEELWDVVRPSPDYALTANGKYREVPANTIARDWNPETGEYAALISGAVTNELLWSSKFDEASWVKQSVDLSATAEEVIVGEAVSKVTPTTASTSHYLSQDVSSVSGDSAAYLAIVKAAGYENIAFIANGSALDTADRAAINLANMDTQTAGSGSISGIDIGNGYIAVVFSCPIYQSGSASIQLRIQPNLTTSVGGWAGDGTSGIYIAHAQLEQGTTPGPVIVTEDAPVTRAADNISRELGSEFNRGEFTLLIDYESTSENLNSILIGSNLQTFNLIFNTASGAFYQIDLRAFGGSLSTLNNWPSPIDEIGRRIKWLFVFQNRVCEIWRDGVTLYSFPHNAALLSDLSKIHLCRRSDGSSRFSANVNEFKIFPFAVNNELRAELTQ